MSSDQNWESVRFLTQKDIPMGEGKEWQDLHNAARVESLADWIAFEMTKEGAENSDAFEKAVEDQVNLMREQELAALNEAFDVDPSRRIKIVVQLLRDNPSKDCLEAVANLIESGGLAARSFKQNGSAGKPLTQEQVELVKHREVVLGILQSRFLGDASVSKLRKLATAVVAYSHGVSCEDVTETIKSMKENGGAPADIRWALKPQRVLTRF